MGEEVRFCVWPFFSLTTADCWTRGLIEYANSRTSSKRRVNGVVAIRRMRQLLCSNVKT
jgi:hypothetical protein